jgi:hypothetical protein
MPFLFESILLSLWLLPAVLVFFYCAYLSGEDHRHIHLGTCAQFGLLWPWLLVLFLMTKKEGL